MDYNDYDEVHFVYYTPSRTYLKHSSDHDNIIRMIRSIFITKNFEENQNDLPGST